MARARPSCCVNECPLTRPLLYSHWWFAKACVPSAGVGTLILEGTLMEGKALTELSYDDYFKNQKDSRRELEKGTEQVNSLASENRGNSSQKGGAGGSVLSVREFRAAPGAAGRWGLWGPVPAAPGCRVRRLAAPAHAGAGRALRTCGFRPWEQTVGSGEPGSHSPCVTERDGPAWDGPCRQRTVHLIVFNLRGRF